MSDLRNATKSFFKKNNIRNCGHSECVYAEYADYYLVMCSFCARMDKYPKQLERSK